MLNETTDTYTIRVPTSVGVSKKKNWQLNLNNYRNTHFQVLNKAKVVFKELTTKDIQQLPSFTEIETIDYVLYRDTKRHCDVANICSVVDKFFCDALVEAQKLPDDNFEFLKNVSYRWGGFTDSNPYVEIFIKGKAKMNLNVNISLTKTDILTAIETYVVSNFPEYKGKFSADSIVLATNKDKDVSCSITIGNSPEVHTKSASNNKSSSKLSGSRNVSDVQPKREEPAVTSGEDDKAPFEEPKATDEAKDNGSVGTTAVSDMETGSTEVSADEGSVGTESVEDEAPAVTPKRGFFAKKFATRPADDESASDNADGEASNPDEEAESAVEVEMEPEVKAASIGKSIFGRKKVA